MITTGSVPLISPASCLPWAHIVAGTSSSHGCIYFIVSAPVRYRKTNVLLSIPFGVSVVRVLLHATCTLTRLDCLNVLHCTTEYVVPESTKNYIFSLSIRSGMQGSCVNGIWTYLRNESVTTTSLHNVPSVLHTQPNLQVHFNLGLGECVPVLCWFCFHRVLYVPVRDELADRLGVVCYLLCPWAPPHPCPQPISLPLRHCWGNP